MEFREKVRAMTAKEIIINMVESLENPITKINMDTFGEVENDVCYGCAATNFICRVQDIRLEVFKKVEPYQTMIDFFQNDEADFVQVFEHAIDDLRMGDIHEYNLRAKKIGLAPIKKPDFELPVLRNNYTQKKLNIYRKLAEIQ